MSPKTAETLGLANEDVVRVDYSGRSLEIPVWLVPGMADGVVALTLGYGRSHAGRIGSGVGFDAFKVRGSKAPGFDSGVTLTKVARTYPLSATQEHGSMEGRPVVRESTLAELRTRSPPVGGQAGCRRGARAANPAEAARPEGKKVAPGALGVFAEEPPHFSLWKEHAYDQGTSGG